MYGLGPADLIAIDESGKAEIYDVKSESYRKTWKPGTRICRKLTQEQKDFIVENKDTITDLIELTRATFSDDTLDGRTKEGRAVRKFLVDENIGFNTTQHEKKEDIKFNEEQEQFIIQYAEEGMTAYEIARIIFPEVNVTNLSKEVIEVASFIKEKDVNLVSPFFILHSAMYL